SGRSAYLVSLLLLLVSTRLIIVLNATPTPQLYTLSLHDALPICAGLHRRARAGRRRPRPRGGRSARRRRARANGSSRVHRCASRSEERRVGKECRSWGAADQSKKKKEREGTRTVKSKRKEY